MAKLRSKQRKLDGLSLAYTYTRSVLFYAGLHLRYSTTTKELHYTRRYITLQYHTTCGIYSITQHVTASYSTGVCQPCLRVRLILLFWSGYGFIRILSCSLQMIVCTGTPTAPTFKHNENGSLIKVKGVQKVFRVRNAPQVEQLVSIWKPLGGLLACLSSGTYNQKRAAGTGSV